jgi:glutamine amidotransferase
MIAIIDYGMGNLRSIHNALSKAKGNPVIISDYRELTDADAIVIPGVGSFGDAMTNLMPFRDTLFDLIDSGIPILGICIGMHVLFDRGEESDCEGFGLIKGDVIRLPSGVKVPQMGWNELNIRRNSDLLTGINNGDFFYFVHSYYCVVSDKQTITATTDYGVDLAAVVEKDNIHAVQFHPEKSSSKGLVIIRNFVEMVRC